MVNMGVFTVFFVAGSLAMGLFLATLINARPMLESLWRNIFFFPLALSLVVTGTVWRWVFNSSSSGLGLDWITNPPDGPCHHPCIAAIWQMSGYIMALYLAGLRNISTELYEAARVDGATELQIFWKIVLPLSNPSQSAAV